MRVSMDDDPSSPSSSSHRRPLRRNIQAYANASEAAHFTVADRPRRTSWPGCRVGQFASCRDCRLTTLPGTFALFFPARFTISPSPVRMT